MVPLRNGSAGSTRGNRLVHTRLRVLLGGATCAAQMVNAAWRQRRAWAVEARLLDTAIAAKPVQQGADDLARIAAGISALAGEPALALVHRYETRLHRSFQRAFHNLLLLQKRHAPRPQPCACAAAPPEPPEFPEAA
jgi:hypothetical protein